MGEHPFFLCYDIENVIITSVAVKEVRKQANKQVNQTRNGRMNKQASKQAYQTDKERQAGRKESLMALNEVRNDGRKIISCITINP